MSIRNVINVYSRKSYILKKKAKPLERKIFSECKEVNDLVVTAKAMACRGLAAPQIGSSLRMFAIKDDYTGLVDIVINPKIVKQSNENIVDEEACLSIPGYSFLVNRSKYIIVNFTDYYGNKHFNHTLTGMEARVFLHEYDHLDGILAPDRGPVLHVPVFGSPWEYNDDDYIIYDDDDDFYEEEQRK